MNEEIKKFADDLWKKEFDKFIVNDIVDRYIKTLQQELDQYKNNWEELKRWLIKKLPIKEMQDLQEVLNKMKELEGE